MSNQCLAKPYSQNLLDYIAEYRREHPGEVRMEDVADWMIEEDLWDPPKRGVHGLLTKDLKRVARESRIEDPQGRKVRAMHAAKTERVDANGNKIFDVVWDHLFEMSHDHALKSFFQRHDNIAKQCNALNRDVQSYNDNNPNAEGREIQLEFDFMVNEAAEDVVEEILESNDPKRPR